MSNNSISIKNETTSVKSAKCRKILSQRIPIVEWLPKYKKLDGMSDLIAGVTLGLTMIPQSIAYAALCELSGQYGLYSAFAGSIIYVFFGTIKEVSIGPTSLMSLLTLEFTRNLPIDFVILLTFLAGCIELLMGVLNLGFLVDFISIPVTSGFTSATSVIIVISQLQGLFGLKYKSVSTIDSVMKLFEHIPNFRTGDTIIGCSSIIFLLIFRKIKDMSCCCISANTYVYVKKILWFLSIGRNALVVIITTMIAYAVETNSGTSPFILSGKVESGLPSFTVPSFNVQFKNETYTFIDMCSTLGSGIIIIPVVAVLANIAVAKSFASNSTIDASQEMLALGICNILSSFVQSMPTCGAFTRSAVSSASGVRTPLAGLYTGTMTLLALSFLTPFFYYIPRAALSAVLISAVIFMIDWSILWMLWKGSKKDITTTITTFIICLFINVEGGLICGILLNITFLLYAWARPSIHVTTCKTEDGDEYILIKPDVGFYYPSADFMRSKINQAAIDEGNHNLPVVLDCDNLKSIDYTAAKGIQSIVKDFDMRGQKLLFFRLNSNVWNTIYSLGIIDTLKREENEAGLVNHLFGTKIEISRNEIITTENEDKGIDCDSRPYHDQNVVHKDQDCTHERKSLLLADYEAVIKELESVEKLHTKQQI